MYLPANNSTRESIYTQKNLNVTCLSAGSAAEIIPGPTANITVHLPVFLVVSMLCSLPRTGKLMEIDLINMSGSDYFLADKTEDTILFSITLSARFLKPKI